LELEFRARDMCREQMYAIIVFVGKEAVVQGSG